MEDDAPVRPPLCKLADCASVKNVLVFISDALRYDTLPQRVGDRGLTGRAFAASSWTASSIPSLMTGQYPHSHGIWMFEDRLGERPPLLADVNYDVGFDCETHWVQFPPKEKPPVRMLGLNEERKLGDLSTPFVHVVHDLGPHAPYGFGNGDYTTSEFFEEYNDPSDLRDRYRADAAASAEQFLGLVADLEERGVLSETLCVFTADHGELLGDGIGGKWGHSAPLCPATLEVPMVFVGAGLPGGTTLSGVLSGVDVAPTCLSALGRKAGPVDGLDLWEHRPADDRRVHADIWQRYDIAGQSLSVYAASALCERDGMWVRHRGSRAVQAAYYLYDVLVSDYAPVARRTVGPSTLFEGLRVWGCDCQQFGTPSATRGEAASELSYPFERDGHRIDLGDEQAANLRDLGYL